jgi:ADP-heptose:LPS heptosyltransferase
MQVSQKTILVMRFSSLGDVALTVPVLKKVVADNPGYDFVMLSDLKYADLFLGIDRLRFQGVDLKNEYRGIIGVIKIFFLLIKRYEISAVADLHGVLRTQLLRILFFLLNRNVAMIYKGRAEKSALTRKKNKIVRPLPHTTERYLNVFEQLGLTVNRQLSTKSTIAIKKPLGSTRKIGFAPFAKHAPKMYPLEKMLEVIHHFDKDGYEIFLFGAGANEEAVINDWRTKLHRVIGDNISMTIADELTLMSSLDLMVTMDSANMHLASLANVPVVSIWGATHPYAGFYGYNQDLQNAIQKDLSCRPCSVYGNKTCWRGDHACMNQINLNNIIAKIEKLIS